MPKNALGSSLDFAATSGPGMPTPSAGLPVADQHVDVLHDAIEHRDCPRIAAGDVPELRAVVEVETKLRHPPPWRLHRFDDHFRRGLRERREDAAAMKPAHAAREDRLPIEIAGFNRAAASFDRL